jgi:hypothetical protein
VSVSARTSTAPMLCAVAVLAAAGAYGQDTSGPGVTVAVSPGTVSAQGAVTISGVGYAQAGTAVLVTVTPPGAAGIALQATPDASGHYSLNFAQTSISGAYQVSARLGAKSPAAQARFSVRTPVQVSADLGAHEQALISDITAYMAQVVQAVGQMPDSPARTVVMQKLQPVQAKLGPLQQSGGYLAHALALFANLQALHPETATVLQPMYQKLDAWDDQEQQRRAALEKQIAQSRSQLAQCDSIDHAIEVLNAVSGALNFAAMPGEIITSFGKDLLASKASGVAGNNAAAAFAISETVKVVPTAIVAVADPLALITVLAGMVVDCAIAAQQNLFAKYCDKFEGNFTATMDAHFMTGDTGLEWWSYEIAIAGKLSLRYPKDASGRAVALSGQFIGHATNFTYHQDFWHTGGLKVLAGGTVHTIDIAPKAVGGIDWDGRGWANLTSPVAFDIPVTGTYADGHVKFTLGDANTDFNPDYTQAHTVYVVMSPLTLELPVWGHFALPYATAHFVLQHYTFDYPVKQDAKSLTVSKHDVQERPATGNKATYVLDLKLCNPGCT